MIRTSRTRRLIPLACVAVFAITIATWLTRQHHQLTLNRELITAIKQSNVVKVESLLAAGADPNTRDTPQKRQAFLPRLNDLLHPAPSYLSPTVLIIAIDQYDSPNSRVVPTIAAALLAKGADPNALYDSRETTTNHGDSDEPICKTPLIEATYYDSAPCVLLLLNSGANPNAKALYDGPPMFWARLYGYSDLVKILKAHGAKE